MVQPLQVRQLPLERFQFPPQVVLGPGVEVEELGLVGRHGQGGADVTGAHGLGEQAAAPGQVHAKKPLPADAAGLGDQLVGLRQIAV
jgi:hypothetical protein